MRQITSVLFILFGLLTTAFAQEQDPWVGTWTSESYRDIDWDSPDDGVVYTTFKRIIRITKSDEGYNVRSKIIKTGDPDYVFYSPAMVVRKVQGSSMWLESYVDKQPFTVNGKIDSYRDVTHRYKISLSQGVLHYSYYEYYYIEYNRRMVYKEQGVVDVGGAGAELDLFNDNW